MITTTQMHDSPLRMIGAFYRHRVNDGTAVMVRRVCFARNEANRRVKIIQFKYTESPESLVGQCGEMTSADFKQHFRRI